MKITLIGTRLAKVGEEFIFNGLTEECIGCKLKNSCMNLEVGRRYRVVSVKEIKHDCKIHDGGVMTVEVIEPPIVTAIESRRTLGSKINLKMQDCDSIDCDFYDICHPIGLRDGDKCTISKSLNNIICPEGRELKSVEVVRLE
jgi:hypothetical protein